MDGIEVSGIVSWPQAFVAVAVILALSIIPQVLAYLKSRKTDAKVAEVQHEFTNNSGSTMRDAIDRIEKALTEHITADEQWKSQAEDLLTRGDDLLE